jgi:prepilin-type processing-associated H-X9-DG protein
LIELLVVIGLIAVLIALAIPAVRRVRQQAARTECAAHLAEIGKAFQLYAADNGGYVPRFGLYPGERSPDWPIWIVALARSLGAPKLMEWEDIPRVRALQCPSHPTERIPSGYVLNAFAFETLPSWDPSPPVPLSKVRRSASVVWVLEAADTFGISVYGGLDGIYFETYHVVRYPEAIGQRIRYDRHVGRTSNILYADGHVATLPSGSIQLTDFDDGIRQR